MRRLIINILFRLLNIPVASSYINQNQRKLWLGYQFPLKPFRDYIALKNLEILQTMGQGVATEREYWELVGRRLELGRLLTDAKMEFAIIENKNNKKEKENENTKDKTT